MPLCTNCRRELEKQSVCAENRCVFCGRLLVSEKKSCLECRETKIMCHVDGAYSLFPYLLWKKELLFQWKTEGNRAFSSFFAGLIHKVLQNNYPDFAVVPVPPRPGKIFREGWDQIEDLCRYLNGLYGTRIYKALRRLSSRQQKKLNRAERLSRVGKEYVLKKKYRHGTKLPHNLVLLDDIMTTGATLETCALILKKSGVQRVYAVTLFSC